ncbi:MAG: radical SAM protein [Candidatus Diapherotrites archaeon]|nr:radical SAM protein [Candidatus Diapherotrites archaeon]
MDEVALLNSFLGSTVVRELLQRMTGNCEVCGNRLYNYLSKYAGEEVNLCKTCELGYETFFKGAILAAKKKYGVTDEELREFVSYTFNRRAILNIAHGVIDNGLQEPLVPRAPTLVVWNVTKACNLHCKHCYENAGEPMPDELTTEEATDLIDKMSNFGVATIAFSGGEPLLRKDLTKLVERASSHGMFVSIATNGTLLSLKKAQELKKAGVGYVEISIDSPYEEAHDEFRGVPGSWRRAWKGLENARKAGMTNGIAYTVTKKSVGDAQTMIKMALGKVDTLMFFNFVPTGRAIDKEELDLSPEEREAFLRQVYEQFEKYQGKIMISSTAPQLGRVCVQERGPGMMHLIAVKEKAKQLVRLIGGCGAGRLYCALEPNGDVKPCVFLPIVVGNVREKPFDRIWSENPILLALRDKNLLEGSCGSCEYKTVCGGCRSRAYALTQNYLGGDPGCIYYKRWTRKSTAATQKQPV